MIKQTEIKNIQSHKHTTIDLHEGVNVITGKSDSGKTAILRALGLLINNRGNLKSKHGKEQEINITLDDGNIIKRQKGKENLYWLNNQRFAAFGTEVPEEIKQVLNIQDVNFQKQFDGPFLLSQTSGEVARHFNKIAGIDLIDQAMKKINSWIGTLKTTINNKSSEVEKLEKKLNEYEFLNDLDSQVRKLEKKEKLLNQRTKKLNSINNICHNIHTIDVELKEYSDIDEIDKEITALLKLHEQKETDEQQYNKLVKLTESIEETSEKIEADRQLQEAGEIVGKLIEQYKEKEKLSKDKVELNELIGSIEVNSTEIDKKQKELKKQEKYFHDNFPGICPLCKTKLK